MTTPIERIGFSRGELQRHPIPFAGREVELRLYYNTDKPSREHSGHWQPAESKVRVRVGENGILEATTARDFSILSDVFNSRLYMVKMYPFSDSVRVNDPREYPLKDLSMVVMYSSDSMRRRGIQLFVVKESRPYGRDIREEDSNGFSVWIQRGSEAAAISLDMLKDALSKRGELLEKLEEGLKLTKQAVVTGFNRGRVRGQELSLPDPTTLPVVEGESAFSLNLPPLIQKEDSSSQRVTPNLGEVDEATETEPPELIETII